MLSHVSLGTNDADRAARFYDPVLAVLGIGKGKRRGGSVDYSAATIGFSLEQPVDGEPASVGGISPRAIRVSSTVGTRSAPPGLVAR